MKMNPKALLSKLIEDSPNDALARMLKAMAESLMSAEVDGLCGADYGERSEARVNRRNGYRNRRWDTRVGTISLAIPKVRTGSYYPEWLLDQRRRAERALVSTIAEAYVQGVSTRRVDRLIKSLGVDGISKSQVSNMALELDAEVKLFRERPLDSGPYPFVWVDALCLKCREGGRVVNVAALVAVGVNQEAKREILGLDVVTSEDGAGWLAFLRSLVARGLSGVQLVTSDAHTGLVAAIGSALPGAAWQRCRTHFTRNVLTKVPKQQQDLVASAVRTIFQQTDPAEVRNQFARVVEQLERYDRAVDLLLGAEADILAFTQFPKSVWRQVWSNNPQERLNKEIRRRTDVVGIFPNRESILRLVGMVLAEQNDEWIEARRYMKLEAVQQSKAVIEMVATPPNRLVAEEGRDEMIG